MKFAKLEIKILVTLFLAAYRYDLVNKDGGFPEYVPTPNYNDIYKVILLAFVSSPETYLHSKYRSREPFYFDFERVVD